LGRSIVSLQLPPGVLVVLLYRDGEIAVPQGGSVLAAGDRLLLLAADDAFQRARQLLLGGDGEEFS
jgi:Trk K+ transport system NAD-binding subunit